MVIDRLVGGHQGFGWLPDEAANGSRVGQAST